MWIDAATNFQKSLAALPLTIYQAGERVLADGSRTDRLLILRKGNVAVVKEGIEIARVTEPGAVFGEISALLDCPHTARPNRAAVIDKTIKKMERLLGASGINLGLYSGYSYNPLA